MSDSHLKYDLALILVTLVWGSTFVLAKDLLAHTPPLNYLSVRFLIATLSFAAISLNIWRKLDRNALWGGLLLGAFLYGGFLAQATGLVYTTPAKSAFVTGVSVILVPFFSYLLTGARITSNHMLAVVLAACGFGLLTMPQTNEGVNRGDLFTLVGTGFWALHIVYTGVWTKRAEARPLLLVQLVVAALFFALSLSALRALDALPALAGAGFPVTFRSVAQLLYLAIFSTIVTIMVQIRVQRHISATRAAIIFSLEPAFAAFFSYLVFGERLGLRAVIGGALIVLAIAVSSRR